MVRPQGVEDLGALRVGKVDVQEDQVREVASREGQSLGRGPGLEHPTDPGLDLLGCAAAPASQGIKPKTAGSSARRMLQPAVAQASR